jgi:hypothetical protein
MKTLSLSLAFTALLMSSSAMAMSNNVQSENAVTSNFSGDDCQKAIKTLGKDYLSDNWLNCRDTLFNPTKVTQKKDIDPVCHKAVDLISEQALGDEQFQSMMNCRYSIANSEGYSLEAVMVISNMNNLIAYIVSVKDGVEVFDQREVDSIVAMANNSISDYQASKWQKKDTILKEAKLTINGIIELKTVLVELTKQLS